MTVNLSIKGVPESLAAKLRPRAERNHRSLRGELMDIVERAADEIDHEFASVALKKHLQGWPAESIALALGDYAEQAIELHREAAQRHLGALE